MDKGQNLIRKSITYSQNFLKDRKLIEDLVAQSSLTSEDIVYEIGSGKGIITEVLASRCKKVIGVEADIQLFKGLKAKFQNSNNVQIYNTNFLTYDLPNYEYKVFSNIPFNITANIIRKLLYTPMPPKDCYVIVQQEAAMKFAGSANKESLFSIRIKPWFELSITHHFKRADFVPDPKVSIVLLRIYKRTIPLITDGQRQLYKDFVAYAFNRSIPNLRKGLQNVFTSNQFSIIGRELRLKENVTPTQLSFEQWLSMFQSFIKIVDSYKKHVVVGAEAKMRRGDSKIDKVHRTRVSRNWKQEGVF